MNISKTSSAIIIVVTTIIALNIVIYLDIPLIRQFFCFLFLAFIPGIAIMRFIKLKNSDPLFFLILSLGFSQLVIIFISMVINYFYPLVGFESPLSSQSIRLSQCLGIGLICLLSIIIKHPSLSNIQLGKIKLNPYEKIILIFSVFLPLLSIYGTNVLNMKGDNHILILLLIYIVLIITLITIFSQEITEKCYPLLIILISFSVIMILPLRSEHIIGIDSHSEFWRWQIATANQFWTPDFRDVLDSCLIISVLPITYQTFMGMDPQKLFNILFSLIFSASPLIIYEISKRYITSYQAFIASFFFISLSPFSNNIMYIRSNMAVFFFGLAIMSSQNDKIDLKSRRILFFIFSSGIIISHYGTTFIIIFLLMIGYLFIRFMRSINILLNHKRESTALSSKSILRLPPIMLFFVLSYLWNSYITGIVYDSGFIFLKKSIISLSNLLLLDSRSSEVSFILGMSDKATYIPAKIELISNWSTIVLIAIGVITSMVYFSGYLRFFFKRHQIYKERIDPNSDIFPLSLALSFMLMLSIIIPFVSTGYSLLRQYILAMVLLSLFLIYGAIILGILLKLNYKYILLTVIILYFLCTTGFFYESFGQSKYMSLGSNNLEYYIYNINDTESEALKWCSYYINWNLKILGDYPFNGWLLSETGIKINYTNDLGSNNDNIEKYKFLRTFNIKMQKMIDFQGENDLEKIILRLNNECKIYDNRGSMLFLNNK